MRKGCRTSRAKASGAEADGDLRIRLRDLRASAAEAVPLIVRSAPVAVVGFLLATLATAWWLR